MTIEDTILERRPNEPWVTKQDGQLTYHLPVESGLVSRLFTFAITTEHLAVLKADEERYYFLFAVLHQRYQMQNPVTAPKPDKHFNLVLFGAVPEVERLLSSYDAASNGAISNLIRITMGRDQEPMRDGNWFATK